MQHMLCLFLRGLSGDAAHMHVSIVFILFANCTSVWRHHQNAHGEEGNMQLSSNIGHTKQKEESFAMTGGFFVFYLIIDRHAALC
jgi:hypothetical protein